jgi:hypothetical protein
MSIGRRVIFGDFRGHSASRSALPPVASLAAAAAHDRFLCACCLAPCIAIMSGTSHRDNVMEAASPDKRLPPSLGGFPAEGQPNPAVHKKKWSTIDVRL